MTATMEKLTAVLSDASFYEENRNLSQSAEIIAAIQARVPEATEEEIDQFLSEVSRQMQGQEGELSVEDLDQVAGGFTITITLAGVYTACKIAAGAGALVGAAVWYWNNRDSKSSKKTSKKKKK